MNITNSIYYTPYSDLLKNGISFSDHSKDRNYYTQLAPLFNIMNSRNTLTTHEVNFLIGTAQKYIHSDSLTFLDIACGTGRHLGELSRKGYVSFGLDTSKELLKIAKETAPLAHLYEADMRSFEVDAVVDCAYSMWDSYVYLSRSTDMDAFGKQCSAHIKRGGILILDSKNYHLQYSRYDVIRRTNQFANLKINTIVKKETYFDDKVYEAIFTSIIEDIDSGEASIIVDQTLARIYGPTELEELLKPHNLRLIQCLGDFDNSRYNPRNSNRMITVFQKF